MKLAVLFLAFAALGSAQIGVPRIGAIQIFGAHHVSSEKILNELGVKPGDPLPPSRGELETKLESVKGVVRAHVEAFCCDAGKPVLYVGILEKGAPAFDYREEPVDEVNLPEEVTAAYQEFTEALHAAARDGEIQEDLSRGYSLMDNDTVKAVQLRFLDLAKTHKEAIESVVLNSADASQRAVAAYLIGYAPQSQAIVNLLQQALRDPDDSVRANAARALKALAVYAQKNPGEDTITVRPTWFVEMLNSLSISDRLEGLRTLVIIYPKLSDQSLQHVRTQALPALQEMAAWQYLPHALPAYLLLGRVAGMSEEELQSAWQQGKRDEELKAIQKRLNKK